MSGEELLSRLYKAAGTEADSEVARTFMRILDRVKDTLDEENKVPEKCPECGS